MTAFGRILENGCWQAWMRGTRGADPDALVLICPELGEAFDALSRGDMESFASEARRVLAESGDSAEETAFIAYRGALEHVAGCGRPYEGGLGRVAGELFRDEAGAVLRRCPRDLATVLRVGTPGELILAGDALLRLLPESLDAARDAEEAAGMAGALDAGAQALVSRCAGLEGVPGYPAAMERVSIVGLFGRLLERSMNPLGPPPDPDDVRALSACIPRRWADGTSALLGELYAHMCSLSRTAPDGGVTREDLADAFVDMSGCPGL